MAQVLEREAPRVEEARERKRKPAHLVLLLLALLILLGGGYATWWHFSMYESTDDAQIDGHLNAISPRISGHVIAVLVEDQEYVKAGEVLVQLDRKDYEVAVAKVRADLADATASLRSSQIDVPITSITTASTLASAKSSYQDADAGLSAADRQLSAAGARLATAKANVRVAEANYAKANQDMERYTLLVAKDEISKQQYDQAVAVAEAARATLDAQKSAVQETEQSARVAEKAIEQSQARVKQAEAAVQSATTGPQQVSVTQARVKSAEARVQQQLALLEQAELNLRYATITAPVSGVVGKKTVEVGQNVSEGQQLLAIVPLDDVWVTANFKETQLRSMKPGQAVKIEVDAYGREFIGKVEHIGGASGARFSLLPPENATGNYVKVVQRIPVRIELDPGQDIEHMLRPGMSVIPTVKIR